MVRGLVFAAALGWPVFAGAGTEYRQVEAADLALAPTRYASEEIEVRGVRCYAAGDEFRCWKPGVSMTIFADRLLGDGVQEAVSRNCSTIEATDHSKRCLFTMRLKVDPRGVGEDRVVLYRHRTLIAVWEATLLPGR